MAARDDAEVFTITSASRGLSRQQVDRQKRYLVSMGIRTACVILALVVPGWMRWVCIAGAVVLPYLAVVLANGGRENDEPGELGVTAPANRQLGAAPARTPAVEPPTPQ